MQSARIISLSVLVLALSAQIAAAQPVLDRVEQLLRRQLDTPRAAGQREPGYLGLVADDRAEQGRGVRILQVTPGGPAEQSGLAAGDLITAIEGRPVRGMDDMVQAMSERGPGTTVTITAERNGESAERRLTVARRPAAPPAATEGLPLPTVPQGRRLGIRTVDVTEGVARDNRLADPYGATVVAITPGLPADRAGIPLGAVIRAVDGVAVHNPQELAAAVAASKGPSVELTYVFAVDEMKARLEFASAAQPPLELRGRKIIPPAPTPGADELPPPAVENERISALEAKVRQLEQRVEKLEAASKADTK